MSDKFRLMMDSKARTREEIEQELKRMIGLKSRPAEPEGSAPDEQTVKQSVRDRIRGIVEQSVRERIHDIVDETPGQAPEEPSYGERIPPRQQRNEVNYITGEVYQKKPHPPAQTLELDELAYPPSMYDDEPEGADIRSRITEMRRLCPHFAGSIQRKMVIEAMVSQGEFMKDVTDDFSRNCFCAIDRPIYGALSTDQLRTYFTWRTNVRRGVYTKADQPYVALYCYELLNFIGVASAAEAHSRLSEVWENCRSFCPELQGLIPRWLKDLRAFNDLSGVEPSPAELWGASCDGDVMDILERRYSGKLDMLTKRSSYDVTKSKFFTEQNLPLIDRALEAALNALDDYFTKRDITMFELLCGRLWKDHSWKPFAGAYVDIRRMGEFHAMKISPLEQYVIKRNEPCLETYEPAPYYFFIGWTIKSVESVLRKRTGFRYGLTINLDPVLADMRNRDRLYAAVSDPEFPDVVKNAVERWCDSQGIFPPKKQKKRPAVNYDEVRQEAPRAPVVIDVSKLARIREEADETTRKLIIEEPETIEQQEISDRMAGIEEQHFDEQAADFAENYSEYNTPEDILSENMEPLPEDLPEGWGGLSRELTERDISLLTAVLEGTAESFCRSCGVMPETEYDRINSSAMEHIGDILIENGAVIEDYQPELEKLLAYRKDRT